MKKIIVLVIRGILIGVLLFLSTSLVQSNDTVLSSIGETLTETYDKVLLLNEMAITAGKNHTCGLTSTGGVKCWGDNYFGQLGDGTNNDSNIPVNVEGLSSGVIAVSAGYNHNCALTTSGEVKCWGDNIKGQLGDGTYTYRNSPVNVVDLNGVAISISSGYYHTCAVMETGEVMCWGFNYYGQLGDGTDEPYRLEPVEVLGLSGIQMVSSGQYHTCAVNSSGGVLCWGDNDWGQLGNGTNNDSNIPVNVYELSSGIEMVSAGQYHTCVVTATGGTQCWGDNLYGQLGNETYGNSFNTPVDVSGQSNGVSAINAGEDHTCSLNSSGGVNCWGYNFYGQLGDGTRTDRHIPVNVVGLTSDVVAVSGGSIHTCAITTSSEVLCWGNNDNGQGGNAIIYNSLIPTDVVGLVSGAITINSGDLHTCAVISTGEVKCWGYNIAGQLGDETKDDRSLPVNVIGVGNISVAVSGGFLHTCILSETGGVKCWGNNSYGQLGSGSYDNSLTPVDVKDLSSGVKAVSAGYYHTCALTTTGAVKCWGYNSSGQLGNGLYTNSYSPVDVQDLDSGVKAVSAGYYHTCAITDAGGVMCWGYNSYGQLGNGTNISSSIPVNVEGLSSGVKAISAGYYHTCALTDNGGVKCWGNNYYGQLGDGTITSSSSIPMNVVGLSSGVVEVSGGMYHTCAITESGGVKCWGDNFYGQLGNGTEMNSNTPVDVIGLSRVVTEVSAGQNQTCVLTDAGGVKCWGDNSSGQLGSTKLWVPIDVSGFITSSDIYLPLVSR